MANQYFQQFLFGFNRMLTFLEGNCVIDSGQSSGTRSLKGSGIKAITKIATGTYKIELTDTYNRYLAGNSGFVSPVTGNTAITAITPGSVYVIRTLGSSTQANWETAGVPKGVSAQPGLAFLAAATSTGSGTVFSPSQSGILTVEVIGDPNMSVTQVADPYLIIQTLNDIDAPANPVDGSVLGITMFLRNSSVKGAGE